MATSFKSLSCFPTLLLIVCCLIPITEARPLNAGLSLNSASKETENEGLSSGGKGRVFINMKTLGALNTDSSGPSPGGDGH